MFRGGHCLQAFISNITKLLISKLVFTAFVAPCIYLLFCLPSVRRLFYLAVSLLHSCARACCPCLSNTVEKITPPGGQGSLDTEFISFVMLLEMSIVYGFAAPLIPVLCLCAILTHLAVFYTSRVYLKARFSHNTKPVANYLVFSLVLGNTFNVACFWGNADQSSKIFVTVGCTGLILGYVLYLKLPDRQAASKAGLQAPLLDPEESAASSVNVQEGTIGTSRV